MSKRSSVRWSTCVLLGIVLLAGRASAQVITINANEQGVGTLVNPVNGTFVLPSSLAPDPGPGGLAAALTYNLLSPPGLVTGDVIVRDQGTGVLSDILRFNPTNGGTLVFYSLAGGGALADTGFPTAFYANTANATEINGIIDYTPTAVQPGFVSGAGFPVTYHITSSADAAVAVPLPAGTWSLLGFLGVWGIKRALRKPALV